MTSTGSGGVQQFFVPSSATRLFLGFADAYTMSTNSITGPPGFYADNDGTLSATFTISLEGDYNQNGMVDAADYVLWRKESRLVWWKPGRLQHVARELRSSARKRLGDHCLCQCRSARTDGRPASALDGRRPVTSATQGRIVASKNRS